MSKNNYVLCVPIPYDIECVPVIVSEEDFCSVVKKISETYPIIRKEELLCRNFLFVRSYSYIDDYSVKWLIGCVYSDIALSVHITKN